MRKYGFLMLLMGCLLIRGFSPARGEDMYIRVVGRDDTMAGQTEKLLVRNAALSQCPADPAALTSALPRIAKAAGQITPCRVDLRPWRPDAAHPPLPTLYVTVGPGAGHNWWGVLYADSLSLAQADDGGGDGDGVSFLWPLWDWLRGVFGW